MFFPSFFYVLVIVEASAKARIKDLSAKVEILTAEMESLRKSLEKNAMASSKAEKELKLRIKDSEEALAEQERLATDAMEATKLVRQELDTELNFSKYLDTEIVSKC